MTSEKQMYTDWNQIGNQVISMPTTRLQAYVDENERARKFYTTLEP